MPDLVQYILNQAVELVDPDMNPFRVDEPDWLTEHGPFKFLWTLRITRPSTEAPNKFPFSDRFAEGTQTESQENNEESQENCRRGVASIRWRRKKKRRRRWRRRAIWCMHGAGAPAPTGSWGQACSEITSYPNRFLISPPPFPASPAEVPTPSLSPVFPFLANPHSAILSRKACFI